MKYSLPILSLLAVLFLSGCSTKKTTEGQDFSQLPVYELKGKEVPTDSAYLRYAYRIRVEGDVAVVFDLHGSDYFCHAFTYPEFDYLSSFGTLGKGPEEIISGSDVRFLGKNRVGILDSNGRKIAIYSGVGKGMNPSLERMVRMEERILMPLDFVRLANGDFLVPDYSGEARFCVVDSCGRLEERKAAIPLAEKTLLSSAAPAVAQAWRSFLAVTPDESQLVTVTQLGDVMDCYALPVLNKETIHRIGEGGEPEFSIAAEGYGIPKGCMGYWDVQVSDSCIYALYDGTRFEDMMKQDPATVKQGASRLRVFDLQGNPLRSYTFDRPVAGIFVDEALGILWATDVNADHQLVSYSLK